MIIPELLLYLFIVVAIVQGLYYVVIFSKLALLKPKARKQKNHNISVIICAKNEAEYLKSFLPFIVNQDYPNYEVILVNDGSTDSSLDIMEIYANRYHHVRVVDVEQNETFWGNKKYALTLGIKAAKFDYLLLTDADCKPLSRYWIKQMSAYFEEGKQIVLGYGAYAKTSFSLLNKLIRYETLITAIQYFSYALCGIPYMGVGRNLAYKKEAFFENNGFVNHMNLLSGDDDLFVNQIATKDNVASNISPFSFTESIPETTLMDWFRQKKRHVSTAFKYKIIHKQLLGLFYLSQLFFWTLFIILLIYKYKIYMVLGLFLGIIIIKYLVIGISAYKLKEKDLVPFLPFLELFLISFQLSIFISNLFTKQSRWK